MRDIRFRIWHKYSEKMYPVSMLYFSKELGIRNGLSVGLIKPNPYNRTEYIKIPSNRFSGKDVIIMQFTGLKDKNGKEIYEGDILKIIKMIPDRNNIKEMMPDKLNLEVKWQRYCELNISEYFLHPDNTTIEIIGNIYENPELV